MGSPSDWVSGERVFAPPTGTIDVDWLVPAVVEAVPGTTPAQARAALVGEWGRRFGPAGSDAAPPEAVPPGHDRLAVVVGRVLDEAQRTFRA